MTVPTAQGKLRQALWTLRLLAGDPPLRDIAARAQVSPSTVHLAIGPNASTFAKWSTLEKIVEALGGDVRMFQNMHWAATRERMGQARAKHIPPAQQLEYLIRTVDAIAKHLGVQVNDEA